jgi:hypothetical protein
VRFPEVFVKTACRHQTTTLQGRAVRNSTATMEMTEQRRSERKRNQTDFLGATETRGGTDRDRRSERRAHEAAVAAAYEPLVGLKQLGEVEGGEGNEC